MLWSAQFTLAFSLEVGEHVDLVAGLEHGGFPWDQRVDEPVALEEGRGLALDPLVVPEHTHVVHVFEFSDVIVFVDLKQANTCSTYSVCVNEYVGYTVLCSPRVCYMLHKLCFPIMWILTNHDTRSGKLLTCGKI